MLCTLHSLTVLTWSAALSCLVKVHQPAKPDLLASFSATCVAREKVSMCQTERKCRQQTGRHGASLARTISHPTAALRCRTASVSRSLWVWCPVQSPQGEHQNSLLSWPAAHAHPNLGCNTLPSSPRFPDPLLTLYTCCIQLESLFTASPWLSAWSC